MQAPSMRLHFSFIAGLVTIIIYSDRCLLNKHFIELQNHDMYIIMCNKYAIESFWIHTMAITATRKRKFINNTLY